MRGIIVGGLALLVVGLILPPVLAEEDPGLRKEVEQLRTEVQTLRSTLLEQEIDTYLDKTGSYRDAQGGDGLQGVSISAAATTVFQGTLGQGMTSEDIGVLDGEFDLRIDFQVSDKTTMWIWMVANNGGTGSFPINYAPTFVSATPTFAGLTDGIGVNGTVPTNPGSVTTQEVGVKSWFAIGDNQLWWEFGEIDPRTRFQQNTFADDENTQFIHNSFDDSAAILWLSGSTGTTTLGWHMWVNFGDNKQWTVNWGWWNTAGQWFANGQFYFQIAWKGEVSGREMNVRLTGTWQEFFTTVTEEDSAGGGLSWDWMATEKIGVFVRITVDGGDVNPIELDGSFGVVFMGPIGSRPDDTLGIAVGFIEANSTLIPMAETEFTLEIYYRFMSEDSKLQVTPHLIFVSDPGGGTPGPFTEDTLFILGLRIHVPF